MCRPARTARRVGGPRTDNVNAYAPPNIFFGGRACKADDGMLPCAIDRRGRHTGQSVHRRNIHNGAAVEPKHRLNFSLHAIKDAQNIGRYRVAGICERYFVRGGGGRVACRAIDGTIQSTKMRRRKSNECFDGRWIIHVTTMKNGITNGAQLRFGCSTRFRVSRGHHHLSTVRDKRLCGRQTDARCSASDQCNFALKAIMHSADPESFDYVPEGTVNFLYWQNNTGQVLKCRNVILLDLIQYCLLTLVHCPDIRHCRHAPERSSNRM